MAQHGVSSMNSLAPSPVPRHVLHATEHLAAGVLAFLALATRELVRAGVHQTLVYSRRDETPADVGALFDPHVRLVEIDGPRRRGRWALLRALRQALRNELQRQRYDAMHLHAANAGLVGRVALGAPASALPPIFYSPHGLASFNRQRPLAGAMAGL